MISQNAVHSKLVHLETKLISLQQADIRYPYDAYTDFPSWYASRSSNPNSVLLANTDEEFNAYTSQQNAWTWLFPSEGKFYIANTGSETLWIKIGNDYVFIIPTDKATIIIKGGKLFVF